MCLLLEQVGAEDPLGAAYSLSNLVIGSALTVPHGPQRETRSDRC